MDNFFNATKLAELCGKSVYYYIFNTPEITLNTEDGDVWLHKDRAFDFINWCTLDDTVETFTAREYFGERFWSNLDNPTAFGKTFKRSVLRGEVSDIKYIRTDRSKRRDLYTWR
jgi:hypothetical protein